MSYDPKTFDLGARYKHGLLLERLYESLQRDDIDPAKGVHVPCESRNEALSLLHSLHRWRKAYRVQTEDSKYEDILMSVEGTTLVAKDRSAHVPEYSIVDPKTGAIISSED